MQYQELKTCSYPCREYSTNHLRSSLTTDPAKYYNSIIILLQERLDTLMDGWMDRWRDSWMDGWIDR